MRIVGIEARSHGLNVYSRMHNPRAGLPMLLTGATQLGHNGVIYYEQCRTSQVDWNDVAHADIIMISSTTSTAPRAYELVRRAREVNSRAPILGGGPHFTFEDQEALDQGIDYVFRHWAHQSFPQWLNWFQSLANPLEISVANRQALKSIHGLSFKVNSQVCRTGRPEEVDPDSWPTPDFRLIKGYKPKFITLITSEGCDQQCEFCSEWTMHGGHYRFRSPEKVMADIAFYRRVYGNIPIFFGDDNLAADVLGPDRQPLVHGHERVGQLCQMIIDRSLEGTYSCQVRLAMAEHPEILDIMAEAGFNRACIGYESINPANAKATGNKLDFPRMEEQTHIFQEHGLSIHAMWILGFDNDTLDTVRRTIQACIKWGIETTQFLALVPLPGALLKKRLDREGRIIVRDWSQYDGHHVVFQPLGMKPWELQAGVMLQAMPKAYNLFLTLRIYVRSNWRTFKRWISRRAPHPGFEFRSHLSTLALRVGGLGIVMRAKGPAKRHFQELKRLVS